jgi:hypothetical protein
MEPVVRQEPALTAGDSDCGPRFNELWHSA